MMRATIVIEQGLLKVNKDWSGWSALTSSAPRIRFFQAAFSEKNLYPATSEEYVPSTPVLISV